MAGIHFPVESRQRPFEDFRAFIEKAIDIGSIHKSDFQRKGVQKSLQLRHRHMPAGHDDFAVLQGGSVLCFFLLQELFCLFPSVLHAKYRRIGFGILINVIPLFGSEIGRAKRKKDIGFFVNHLIRSLQDCPDPVSPFFIAIRCFAER